MNTIRELKQQEKYKSMLKRKNKEKKIYKDKNASLQLEKQRLYIALRNKDKEKLRLNKELEFERQIKKEAIEYINKHWGSWCSNHYRNATNVVNILKGSDKE